MRNLACLVSIFFCLFFSSTANAYVGDAISLPPHDDYLSIKTNHFEIIAPEKLRVEAQDTARLSEEIHAGLSPFFNYAPSGRTVIIVTDNRDFANGVTSAVGHQGIILFLKAPDPYTSLGEYDNWLKLLILHEYAHYLTLDQTNGLFKAARYLFGALLLPNHAWPSWLAEGIAVWAETRFTTQGRGRGAYYATLLRDSIARGEMGEKFLPFDEISGPRPDFPFGEMAYFAGYGLISQLAKEMGEKKISQFAEESSWRIPFLNNGTLENIGGSSFQRLWSNWLSEMRGKFAGDIKALKDSPHDLSKKGQFASPEFTVALGTRLSPDETRVAYTFVTGHDNSTVRISKIDGSDAEQIDDAVSGSSVAWSADGKTLYYSKVDFRNSFRFYGDLYKSEDGSVSRLTNGERAKDPDYCSDGTIVFSSTDGAFAMVKSLDLKTRMVKTLYQAPRYHQVANPRCSPDAKKVYFSEHGTTAYDWIASIEKSGGKPTRVVSEKNASALYPEPREEGLYYTLLKNQRYEAVLLRGNSRTLLANGIGGYWFPSVGKNKIAFSHVSSHGIRALVADKPSSLGAATLVDRSEPNDAPAPAQTPLQERSYNLLYSLAPRIWSPDIIVSKDDRHYGFLAVGWDDTDQLQYTLNPRWDTFAEELTGSITTFQRIAGFRLQLLAESTINAPDLIGTLPIYFLEKSARARVSYPFPGAFSSWEPALVAEYNRTWFRFGDRINFRFPSDARYGGGLIWTNERRFAYSIAPEYGALVDIEARKFFSGPVTASKFFVHASNIFPIVSHSSLSLNAYGAMATAPRASIPASFVNVGGQGDSRDLEPPLRGYSLESISAKRAVVGQAELRLPLAQVFTGWGLFPAFLKNIGVFGFYDAAKLQFGNGTRSERIDSVGGGILLNTVLGYNFPVNLRFEYAQGLSNAYDGEQVFTFRLE